MIEVTIPGYGEIALANMVLDYNGTLAVDGILVPGVAQCLGTLAEHLKIHVVTADTFGLAQAHLKDLPCELTILPAGDQDVAKMDFVNRLGPEETICIGNGRNDRKMLEAAALGIAILLDEGAAVETIQAADVLCRDIVSALELLNHPLRLTATLRS
jgi:soluble P-type ATPase